MLFINFSTFTINYIYTLTKSLFAMYINNILLKYQQSTLLALDKNSVLHNEIYYKAKLKALEK